MPIQIQKFFDSLPVYWRLATVRVLIYSFIVGASAFDAGVEGFNAISEMSWLMIGKLVIHIVVAMAGVLVAFLDQSMSKISGSKTTDTLTLSHTEQISPANLDAPLKGKTGDSASLGAEPLSTKTTN